MPYTIHRVLQHEYVKYRAHLKELDSESKLLRFGYTVSDTVIDSLCDKFEKSHTDHVLFCIEDKNHRMIAVGHIAITDTMELAFSVSKEYQGIGLGGKLMQRCIRWCRAHGILKGNMVCLSRNSTIRHLCRKNGIGITVDGCESVANIELLGPDVFTHLNEATEVGTDLLIHMSKQTANYWSFKTNRA